VKKANQKKLEEIKETVDEAIEPDNMTQAEAKEFLDELIGDLQVRLDALNEEMQAGEG
jgi:polyhydroxyalkanoate synthesis regulator phasin